MRMVWHAAARQRGSAPLPRGCGSSLRGARTTQKGAPLPSAPSLSDSSAQRSPAARPTTPLDKAPPPWQGGGGEQGPVPLPPWAQVSRDARRGVGGGVAGAGLNPATGEGGDEAAQATGGVEGRSPSAAQRRAKAASESTAQRRAKAAVSTEAAA